MRILIFTTLCFLTGSLIAESRYEIYPFGEKGKIKMLYDRRQGPQNLLVGNKLHVVYNGNAEASVKGVRKDKAFPLFISYDLKERKFSSPIQMGDSDSDHHFSPVLWMDKRERMHILHGCHSTVGTHLVSKEKTKSDPSKSNWKEYSEITKDISYPTFYNIYGERQLMYYRHKGHRGAWTYVISSDQGKSWQAAKNFVTDMNMGDDLTDKPLKEMDEMSSYQSTALSNDGKTLHIVFSHYDDNKDNLPEKFINPRYETKKNLGIKFNLYYVKINLENHEVSNFAGNTLATPIDLTTANAKCKIWDTDHRGAGIPAQVILDENDQPSFLHVLTEDKPDNCNYYYVHRKNGKWEKTVITKSNHEWNCGYLFKEDGKLNAFLLNRDTPVNDSFMDKHGGGTIEKWISSDEGKTWTKEHNVLPKVNPYSKWRFNNIKPVLDAQGKAVKGMFLCYGWNENKSTAKAFLIVDKTCINLLGKN